MFAYDKRYLPGYSYDDYKEWKGDWELIYGIPYAMSPAPSISHQETNSKIIYELMSKLKGCKECKALPEVDWKIDDETVVRPDSLVVCNLKNQKSYLDKVPEMIFEVLSPSTKKKDRNLKSLLYAQNGVKYYILVEPNDKYAEVYKLKESKYRLERVFKSGEYRFDLDNGCGFDFSFTEIFED